MPTVNMRHELIPELCKELMSLYEGHQALIEQDKKDARPQWDQKVSKRDQKELRQLGKPPKPNDLAKADERSRKQKALNAKTFSQPKTGDRDEADTRGT